MYEKGAYIFHENNGVCRVEEISEIAMNGRGSEKLYYTLSPQLESKSMIYTLVDAPKSKVRDLMTRDEIASLLGEIPAMESKWVPSDKIRIQYYKDALSDPKPYALMQLLKTVYDGNHKRALEGKKMLTADDRYYQLAGKKLFDEVAFVYELTMKEAEELVEKELEKCFA